MCRHLSTQQWDFSLLICIIKAAGPNEVKKQHVTGEAEGVGRPINNNLARLSWVAVILLI